MSVEFVPSDPGPAPTLPPAMIMGGALMSAINVVCYADQVHIATDGLAPGNEPHLTPKVHVAPHVPLVIASRGAEMGPHFLGTMFHKEFAGFDAIVAGIEAAFPGMHEKY